MNEKPVVGHLIHSYLMLTGSWIYHQLTGLRRHHPVVITRSIQNFEEFPLEDVYQYSWPLQQYYYLGKVVREIDEWIIKSRLSRYVDRLSKKETSILHAHFGPEGYQNLNVARTLRLPLITTFYGVDVSMLPRSMIWKRRYHRLFAEGSCFLAEGSFMAQALVDLGCPSTKVRVQHLGIDLERVQHDTRVQASGKPVRLLMAASFREKKGIPYAIQAFAKALRKFSPMELYIVGGASSRSEQQLMSHCKDLVRQYNIAGNVRFLGYLNYRQYLQESKYAHIFLAPSITASNGDTEGGAPVSLIEASASGMPVIATRHCDIPEVVVDGQSGILVEERDIDGLSTAILELATSPGQWQQMGYVGRAHIEAEYDVLKQVAVLENIYDSMRN